MHLFSQTTMNVADFRMITNLLKSDMSTMFADAEAWFNWSIYLRRVQTEPHLKAFANKHDVIIFVSKESSNGRMLYSICKSVNPDSYL